MCRARWTVSDQWRADDTEGPASFVEVVRKTRNCRDIVGGRGEYRNDAPGADEGSGGRGLAARARESWLSWCRPFLR
jgi:hypothetical protein